MTDRLETLADEMAVCAQKAENYQATLAQKMAEARAEAERTGRDWNDVLDTVIRPKIAAVVGPRRVQQIMKIGRAENPVAALADHREQNRAAVARHRELRNSHLKDPLARTLAMVNDLPPEHKAHVAQVAAVEARKALPAPKPPADPKARAFAALDEIPQAERLNAIVEYLWRNYGMVPNRPEPVGTEPVARMDGGTQFDPETGEIYENGEHQPGPIKNPLPVGDACSGSSSEAPLASGAGAAQGRCEPAAPPIQGSAARLASVPHPPAEAHDDRSAEPPPVAGTAADSIPPAGLTDDDFPDIPSFLDRRGELARTTDDPAAPDERPAATRRVRA